MNVPAEPSDADRATPFVQLRNVTRRHGGDAPALDRVSLDIRPREFVAVMGPSGSGKSTLLNLVAGMDRTTDGEVIVCGMPLNRLSETALSRLRRRTVGMVFQFFNLLPTLTVVENVVLSAQLAGGRSRSMTERARDLLSRLGVEQVAHQYPARLSGGQQQRVAIARALINEPSLLLADEPTGALDSASGREVMDVLRGLHRRGQTILFVTHDAKLAARYASRIITLVDGRVESDAAMTTGDPSPTDVVRFGAEA